MMTKKPVAKHIVVGVVHGVDVGIIIVVVIIVVVIIVRFFICMGSLITCDPAHRPDRTYTDADSNTPFTVWFFSHN